MAVSTRWEGGATAVAQVQTYLFGGTWETDDLVRLQIGNRRVTVVAESTSVNTVVDNVVTAWNALEAASYPEFARITASRSSSSLVLTANEEGEPFTCTITPLESDGSASGAQTVAGGTGSTTGTTATAATGPNHWTDASNWSSGTVPATGVCEVWLVDLASGTASGGTWTFTYGGQTTAGLDWDASAATVQAAIQGLSSVGSGNMTVTGTDVNTGYTITAANTLGYQPLVEPTINGGSLTGSTPVLQIATTVAGALGDDVYIDNNRTVPIKYGIDQSSVVLNSLTIAASYEQDGKIGLPEINTDGAANYPEYRQRYLRIGVYPGLLRIGDGDGQGSSLLNIDSHTYPVTVVVNRTGTGQEVEAMQWKGVNTANSITVNRGEVAIAGYGGDVSTVGTLRAGSIDSESSDVSLYCGAGLTLTTLQQDGGSVAVNGAVTTVSKSAGTLTVDGSGAVATLANLGGVCRYRSTGTLGTPTVGPGAVLDFSDDNRPKTVTNAVQLHFGATLIAPASYVTLSAGFKTNKCRLAEVVVDCGQDRTYSVS